MLGLWGFQWWGPPKAPGLLFAGFEMCLALDDPLAPPVFFRQGALEEACGQTVGVQGPLEMAHFSVCLEYPGPWLLAAFPPPRTVPPHPGQPQ